MVQERKKRILSDFSGDLTILRKNNFQEHDLLGLLIRASLASDVSAKERMTDEEIVSRTLSLSHY